MIGVVAKEEDREVVRELFELFKTPWEFYEAGSVYDVVLAPATSFPSDDAPARIVFGSELEPSEDASLTARRKEEVTLSSKSGNLPLYGTCLVFEAGSSNLGIVGGEGSAAVRSCSARGTSIRLGYDLFDEIRFLLSKGQPASNANFPTLDLHIQLLREFIVSAGVPLVEIPPIPAGHPFSVCLTHDVDHPLLRNHWIDHTALGFLFRATVGSVDRVIRGRLTVREALRNFSAALRFPFVHFRWAFDFWSAFDRYMDIERDLASTFFVIPRRGVSGRDVRAVHPERRAASYSLEQILPQLDRIRNEGGEIGLHGIDAWAGIAEGRAEQARIAEVAGCSEIGVRMHWLCFDENSPCILDAAGFYYDSTIGYNETVGYRAGTLQVFQPPGVTRLLELPLHVMDTALFYPAHLDFSRVEAATMMRQLYADAVRLGGVLTLNWHDRSIAPERQWGDFYAGVLEELKRLDPWFATATEATAWFRMRRSAVFEEVRRDGRLEKVRVKVAGDAGEDINLPGLRLRITRTGDQAPREAESASRGVSFEEEHFRGETEIDLAA